MVAATEVTYTPGPWAWQHGELVGQGPTVVGLGDDGGCSDPECCGGASYHLEVSHANARLIAAAPELLEALKNLLSVIETEGTQFGVATIVPAARAAIAKATGRAS